ncbi:MAG: hypothetical protein C5B49_08480 [Bdellovibrio sp.]|nr:MAG: hypothetical protein C5B49_08480 [Bdellovibrio sp.]
MCRSEVITMRKRHHSGFTLLEIVVATALAAVVLAMSATAVNFFNVNVFNAEQSVRLNDLTRNLGQLLAQTPICTRNFSGVTLDLTSQQPTAVTSIGTLAADGSVLTVLQVQTPPPHPSQNGLFFSAVKLYPINSYTPSTQTGSYVNADLEIDPYTQLGPTTFSLHAVRIPLLFSMSGNTVIECVSQNLIFSTLSRICALNGQEYDPASQACKTPNYKWYVGNVTTASCPAGQYVATFLNPPCSCLAPGSFIDPMSTTRKMSNGQSTSGGPPPAIGSLNASGTACTCSWGVDVSTSSGNFTTQIACLQ